MGPNPVTGVLSNRDTETRTEGKPQGHTLMPRREVGLMLSHGHRGTQSSSLSTDVTHRCCTGRHVEAPTEDSALNKAVA